MGNIHTNFYKKVQCEHIVQNIAFVLQFIYLIWQFHLYLVILDVECSSLLMMSYPFSDWGNRKLSLPNSNTQNSLYERKRYICVHTDAYTCIHVPIHVHTRLHMCIHIHTYIHVYARAHVHAHVHVCAWAHMHAHIRTYMHTYAYAQTRTLIYTRTHAHTYMHMHVHMDTWTRTYTRIHTCTHLHAYMHT